MLRLCILHTLKQEPLLCKQHFTLFSTLKRKQIGSRNFTSTTIFFSENIKANTNAINQRTIHEADKLLEKGTDLQIKLGKINEQVLHYYLEAAKQGSYKANSLLGEMYFTGTGVEKNLQKAVQYFEKASYYDGPAALNLVQCHNQGIKTRIENNEQVKELLEFAAQTGILNAQEQLILGYYHGIFTDKEEPKQYLHWCEKASKQNSDIGNFLYALHFLYNDQPENFLSHMEKAVELKYKEAFLYLGECYKKGICVQKDISKAFYYYKLGIHENNVSCLLEYGILKLNHPRDDKKLQDIENGWNYVKKAADLQFPRAEYLYGNYLLSFDDKEQKTLGFLYVKNSFAHGYDDASILLGRCYFDGLGTERNENLAIHIYNKASDKGILAAHLFLGEYYLKNKEFSKSFQFYLLGAKLNVSECEFQIGSFYFTGIDSYLPKNELEAENWLIKAANKKHVLAMKKLGAIYLMGSGNSIFKADSKKALYYLEYLAEKLGDIESIYYLACYYTGYYQIDDHFVPNLQKAFHYFKRAADADYFPACTELGFWYLNGNSIIDIDYEKSIFYSKIGALHNDKNAFYNLALCYLHGYGIEKDYSTAFEYFKKSAKLGNISAQKILGNALMNGDYNIKKNLIEGKKWITFAAELGDVDSQVYLAKLEFKSQNPAASLLWFTKAAENNDKYAQFFLGQRFIGSSDTRDEGIELLKLSAEQNYQDAQLLLAENYVSGKYLKKDIPEAIRLYSIIAESGNVEAQYFLGFNLVTGNFFGVKDINQGLHWVHAAAKQKHEQAIKLLGNMAYLDTQLRKE